ncbi:MAG: hypothetical protein EBT63_03020 [Proteobacteria bacterium]|nr:hypothetical protein [Pseudomonadota bacterium]NCA28142.1 hypothetical protein [Pseudomonadota bacterium]
MAIFDDLFKNNKNSSSAFEIEIEKNHLDESLKQPEESQLISPNEFIRKYEHIKILPINPNHKNKLEKLTHEIRDDLQRLKRIINSHF